MDAFKFLKQRLRGRLAPMINHVDCALDFVTSTRAKAEKLQLAIDARWYKQYHRRKHDVAVFEQSTTYFGFKNWQSKYVTYADKPSRHGGGPCCHLECRFQSKRPVAALGIDSIGDLLAFDHRAFWKKRLRLYEYDPELLGKRWNGRHLSSAPVIWKSGNFTYNVDRRIGETLVRAVAAMEGRDRPILMDVLTASARWGRSVARVLVAVPAADMLSVLRTPNHSLSVKQ